MYVDYKSLKVIRERIIYKEVVKIEEKHRNESNFSHWVIILPLLRLHKISAELQIYLHFFN